MAAVETAIKVKFAHVWYQSQWLRFLFDNNLCEWLNWPHQSLRLDCHCRKISARRDNLAVVLRLRMLSYLPPAGNYRASRMRRPFGEIGLFQKNVDSPFFSNSITRSASDGNSVLADSSLSLGFQLNSMSYTKRNKSNVSPQDRKTPWDHKRQWIKIKVSHVICCKTISANPALLKVALYTTAMHCVGSYRLMAKPLRNSIWCRDDSPEA